MAEDIQQTHPLYASDRDVLDSLLGFEGDEEAKYYLTFPGPNQKGIHSNLIKDFAMAREQNQKFSRPTKHSPEASKIKEIDLRNKTYSNFKLSKEEVRRRNKFQSVVAYFFDGTFIFLCSLLIAEAFTSYAYVFDSNFEKDAWFVIILLLGLSLFYAFNFIYLHYSIGESLSGIKKKHRHQSPAKN